MEVIRGTAALERRLVRPVLTIGNFDGVHLGHRAILDTVIGRARALRGEAVLYTFDPHPRKVLHPDRAPDLLTTMEQKEELLREVGIDVLIVEPFDAAFARTEPEVFVREHVHARIRPVEVYVGYDFHFGRDREGSMRLLTETGPRLGFSVTIIPEVTVGGQDVNSTRVRELLRRGAVEDAAELLGRPFSVRGPVVSGRRRGRELGFPTANLATVNEIMPGPGVYVCALRFLDDGEPARGTRRHAVTNVGYRPTFQAEAGSAQHELIAEAHVLDFSGDLYGRRTELSFLALLRPEQKFDGPVSLAAQIARDVEATRSWFAAHDAAAGAGGAGA